MQFLFFGLCRSVVITPHLHVKLLFLIERSSFKISPIPVILAFARHQTGLWWWRGEIKHLMSQEEQKHPFGEYFYPDSAFVGRTQSNLRYVRSPKPNQPDMWVIEQENATGPVPPVSTVLSDNHEIVEDKGRHTGKLSHSIALAGLSFCCPSSSAPLLPLSCVTKQL